jgi:hypothetical protein
LGSAHASHWPEQALSQQTLSTQAPVMQSSATVHACPCLALQVPAASQVLVVAQVSGSSALVTGTQVPPPPVQAWQVPQALTVQQRPSTQLPVVQSVPAAQLLPGVVLHVPAAVQVLLPLQLSGSSALVTAAHVPPGPVQAWQEPQVAVPQQRPSRQCPEVHSPSAPQALPLGFFAWHAPAELQNWLAAQGAVVALQPPEQVIASAQRLLAQGTAVPGRQLPAASHVGAGVALPPVQLEAPHMVPGIANPQAIRFVPSHIPAQAPWPVQAARLPRGAPLIATQVPFLLASPQASHCP